MPKSLKQQKRGKGSPAYKAPSHRFTRVGYYNLPKETQKAKILDIVHSVAHSAPILRVSYDNGMKGELIAASGLKVGDELKFNGELKNGNVLALKDIPEGTLIFGIENNPGDGGKFVRSSGGFAKIISKSPNKVTVLLPSKKEKAFNPACKASIGVVAGSGRIEKPLVKAGNKYRKVRARNRYWPRVSGASMNAVDHPFGGTRSSRKGRPTIAPRNAPPGRKVGMIRPKRTGRKKK